MFRLEGLGGSVLIGYFVRRVMVEQYRFVTVFNKKEYWNTYCEWSGILCLPLFIHQMSPIDGTTISKLLACVGDSCYGENVYGEIGF
jgi:hypothetical protein